MSLDVGNKKMKIDPTQSIARSIKTLIWLIALPTIVFSIFFVIMIVDHFSRASLRAESNKPLAYPIRMAGKPIPEDYSALKNVSLKVESMGNLGNTRIINLRLINPTDQPVVYVVHSGSNPYHLIQTQKDGKWVDLKNYWFVCGNSQRRTVCINPNESAQTSVEIDTDLFPVKIGMEYANGTLAEQTVWAEPIELDQIRE